MAKALRDGVIEFKVLAISVLHNKITAHRSRYDVEEEELLDAHSAHRAAGLPSVGAGQRSDQLLQQRRHRDL